MVANMASVMLAAVLELAEAAGVVPEPSPVSASEPPHPLTLSANAVVAAMVANFSLVLCMSVRGPFTSG